MEQTIPKVLQILAKEHLKVLEMKHWVDLKLTSANHMPDAIIKNGHSLPGIYNFS